MEKLICGGAGDSLLYFAQASGTGVWGTVGKKELIQALRKDTTVFRNVLDSRGRHFSWGGLICEGQ